MGKLELRGLRKAYPNFTLELDLSVEEGEFLTVIGPSGSGKSTLLSLISGLESPDSGQILLDGKDIVPLPPQKRSVGLVFQDYALFPSMSVEDNVSYALKVRHIPKKEGRQAAGDLLDFVSLPGYGKRKVTTLSGGEAQRVALARALAGEPSVMLLDEPLSALDAALRRHLRDEIRRIHDEDRGLTTVYVTHDREEAFAISDRIAIVKDGKLEMAGTPEEVYKQPATLFTAFFTGEGTKLPTALFNLDKDADTVFFRPEAVAVRQTIFYGDADSWLELGQAEVMSSEFLGRSYLLGLRWQGHPILAESTVRPTSRHIDLYLDKSRLIFFKDGRLVP